MGQVVRIGLDLAKSVFQVHGVDEAGEIVVRRKYGDLSCWPSSPSSRRVWWGWRPAPRRTIGRGS